MTDDRKALLVEFQRANRRWRVAAIIAFSGLLLLFFIQAFFIIDIRNQVSSTHEAAEQARKAVMAARRDAGEARRLVGELTLQAERNESFAWQSDADRPFLFPTDQMYRASP